MNSYNKIVCTLPDGSKVELLGNMQSLINIETALDVKIYSYLETLDDGIPLSDIPKVLESCLRDSTISTDEIISEIGIAAINEALLMVITIAVKPSDELVGFINEKKYLKVHQKT